MNITEIDLKIQYKKDVGIDTPNEFDKKRLWIEYCNYLQCKHLELLNKNRELEELFIHNE